MAATPVKIAIIANAAQARKELSGFARETSSLGDKMNKLKRVAGVGLAIAGAAAVKFGVDSVRAASESQQSLGATETIFERFANTVIRTSESAATKYGLSANQYRESANLLGSLFKNQGVALNKLSGETQKHVGLAADLSAMYGGPATDAIDAITAAYKGEFNQLEKYGITIKQSTINTEADAVAKQKYGKALTDLTPKQEAVAKQIATQNILFRQGADAQGTFARESNTLAGQQQRLAARFEDIKAKVGSALIPVLVSLAKWAGDTVVPALEKFAEWLANNSDEISKTATSIKDVLLPPLQALGNIVKAVGGFLGDIPAPLRNLALQAGLAALVLPRLVTAASGAGGAFTTLSAKVRQNYAEMTYATTRAEKLKSAFSGMGAAARSAAGIGGLLAISAGAQTANSDLKTLANIGGGALLGFSVGGPIGAAVGGLAGLTLDLATNTQKSGVEFITAADHANKYAGALDGVIDKQDKMARANVWKMLQKDYSEFLPMLDQLGVRQGDLIGLVTDEAGARQRVIDKIREGAKSRSESDRNAAEAGRILLDLLRRDTKVYDDQIQKNRERNSSLLTTKQIIGSMPKQVRTFVKAEGVPKTMKDIAQLDRRYKLTPKEVRSIIRLTGVDASVKQIDRYNRQVKKGADEATRDSKRGGEAVGRNFTEGTKKAKPDFNPFKRLFQGDVKRFKTDATLGGLAIARNIETGTSKARADLGPFSSTLLSRLRSLQETGRSGGSSVGSAVGSGFVSGIGQWVGDAVAATANLVSQAIAAARSRRGADARSPSRKTIQLGKDMGEGLVIGLQRSEKKAEKAGRSLVDRIIGKSRGADAWKKLDKALAKVNDRLREARSKFNAANKAASEYANSIRDSFIQSGNITTLGQQEDGSVSGTSLINELKDRLVAAQRFANLIRDLTSQGLNKTSLKQLLEAGVEGGLATAEALAAGGAVAISEVNTLTNQIAQQGASLGNSAASTFYDAGIKAARGLVRGLERDSKAIERAADRIAKNLSKAVRKRLGIKSPSTVFRDIGKQTAEGLRIGLQDARADRYGEVLARDLKTGFGRPALDAFASQTAGSGHQTITVRLTADQVSRLQQGREIQMSLDAYYAAGGRRRAG